MTPNSLYLIKHARPEIDPDVPAHLWHLSFAGRASCNALAHALEQHALTAIISSTEPKAIETAQIVAGILGIPTHSMPGLHEHDRSNEPYHRDTVRFEQAVLAFFAQPDTLVYGRETAVQATERFSSAVATCLQAHTGNLAIVAHGTVISLLVARTNSIAPYPLWKRLGLPSIVSLNLPDLSLVDVTEKVGDYFSG